jgi:HK97 family phage major capsid protein
MTREKYLEQRNALLAEVESLIAESKIEDSNAKMEEVKDLDNKWEQAKLANANLNALKGNTAGIELEDKGVEPKGGVTVVETVVENKAIDQAALYEVAWAKTLQGRKLQENEQAVFDKVNSEFHNAYTHDTDNTSVLIPQTVVAGIWKRAMEMYPLLGDIHKFGVKGTLTIPKHTAINEGDAAWYDEDTQTADEKNTFGTVTLSGCELAKAITVSWKLRSMATEDFIPYIKNELGERIGVALGTAIAQGKGQPGASDDWKPEPQGIETALNAESDTPQVVTYNPTANPADPMVYKKITDLIAKVHSSYLSGSAFYANNATIWSDLANILDTNGRPIFIPDTTAGGIGRLLGFVVKSDAGVSAGSVIFGNPNKGYVFNTNEPMSLASEEHVKARTVDYAAYTIVDGAVLDTKAFALLKKSS